MLEGTKFKLPKFLGAIYEPECTIAVMGDDGYVYDVDDEGKALRRRLYEGTRGGMIRRKCRACGLLLPIRRGRQRFVRAPYIWVGKAFCNTCAETREQQDDHGLPWEEL